MYTILFLKNKIMTRQIIFHHSPTGLFVPNASLKNYENSILHVDRVMNKNGREGLSADTLLPFR